MLASRYAVITQESRSLRWKSLQQIVGSAVDTAIRLVERRQEHAQHQARHDRITRICRCAKGSLWCLGLAVLAWALMRGSTPSAGGGSDAGGVLANGGEPSAGAVAVTGRPASGRQAGGRAACVVAAGRPLAGSRIPRRASPSEELALTVGELCSPWVVRADPARAAVRAVSRLRQVKMPRGLLQIAHVPAHRRQIRARQQRLPHPTGGRRHETRRAASSGMLALSRPGRNQLLAWPGPAR